MKLAITLRFYSTGDFYGPLGDLFGISKSAVEYIIAHVSWLIASRLRQRFIRMPSTRDEIISAKIDFMRLSGFPMCITAIDGTHVQSHHLVDKMLKFTETEKRRFHLTFSYQFQQRCLIH